MCFLDGITSPVISRSNRYMDYLNPYKDSCDISALSKIKEKKDEALKLPSNIELKNLFENLPDIAAKHIDLSQPEVIIGSPEEINEDQRIKINDQLKTLIPWRKGPFKLFETKIDAEWRSDFKWERIKKALPSLEDKKILDIGCNNGYFMFKMAHDKPSLVLGIDPVLKCQLQFKYLQHFAKVPNLHFELFGIEHLNHFKNFFDVIFSMGIIYHHRNPIEQLLQIRDSLMPGGYAVLETIGIPGEDPYCLFPEDRYAGMRNVWFMPTISCFINWAKKAKFQNIEVISDSWETKEEQRLTKWCPPPHHSLERFLDPTDESKTVEGHPAPRRFCLLVQKRLK